MNRKNTITRAEFNQIENKLKQLIDSVNQYNHLYMDIDDLLCLADSLVFLKQGRLKDLKLID